MRQDIGVLALQGDFDAHRQMLRRCGVDAPAVRLPSALAGLRGLVLPGGESTTLLRLMGEYGFDEAIRSFVERGGALFGTCAGAILLARGVFSPQQRSLDLLDIDVERNGYGRQIDSFETRLTDVAREVLASQPFEAGSSTGQEDPASLAAVFIRAPRVRRVGAGAAVLASREGEPVLVREGRLLVATFHPELTGETRVHRYFAGLTNGVRPAA